MAGQSTLHMGIILASRPQGLQQALTSVVSMVNWVDLDCPVHKS